jgi:hypothetical protein
MFSKTRQFLKCRRIQGPIWGLDSNRHHFAGADLRGETDIISTVNQVQIREEYRVKYEYFHAVPVLICIGNRIQTRINLKRSQDRMDITGPESALFCQSASEGTHIFFNCKVQTRRDAVKFINTV